MKKLHIFYLVDSIWIIIFGLLALYENSLSETGLSALETLGKFSLYSLLCLIGMLCFIFVGIIQLFKNKIW